MFERYTERARRVLFFARYEATQLGSMSIETEHLLLGLIREGKGLTSRIFARSKLSLESIRKEIEGRTILREMVSTSGDIPFSADTNRVLQFAAEEADRLLHTYIGTEHLLLGILRDQIVDGRVNKIYRYAFPAILAAQALAMYTWLLNPPWWQSITSTILGS